MNSVLAQPISSNFPRTRSTAPVLNVFVAHDPALAHVLSTCFELGFNQNDDPFPSAFSRERRIHHSR